jgi:hypothetical protein
MNSAKDYRKLNSQESLNEKKLKIPPAFVSDQWVCNHKSAKKKEYLDSLNLREIKFQNIKIDKSSKNSIKPFKSNNNKKIDKKDSPRTVHQSKNEVLAKIPEIKEKNYLSKVISNKIGKIKIDLKAKHKQKILFTKLNKNEIKSLNNNSNNEMIDDQNTQIMQDISINEYESQDCENLKDKIQIETNSNLNITSSNSMNNSNQCDDSSEDFKQSFEGNRIEENKENLSDEIRLISKSNQVIRYVNDNIDNEIIIKRSLVEGDEKNILNCNIERDQNFENENKGSTF